MCAEPQDNNLVGSGFALMLRREVYEQNKKRLRIGRCGLTNSWLKETRFAWITFPTGTRFEESTKSVRFILPNGDFFSVNVSAPYGERVIFDWKTPQP